MPMKDGFKTLITFPSRPNLVMSRFAEVSVKPFGYTGRGPIDITSMRNNTLTTKWPKSLVDITNMTLSVQWEPNFYTDVRNELLLKNQRINTQFSDGSKAAFYGWLDEFEPQEMREGEVPLANITLISSNLDGGLNEAFPFLF